MQFFAIRLTCSLFIFSTNTKQMIEGVLFTELKIIPVDTGNVLHAMKKGDSGECGLGEAYFSTVEPGAIKGWKRHQRMTLNLVVPMGEIRFVLFDDRHNSLTKGEFLEEHLSQRNYLRLTVPPGIWVGFKGCGKGMSIALNIADIPHDPYESDRLNLNEIAYDWGIST